MEKLKILVGLSGGVDSAVSAYLLKQAWHEVHCGFMINYLDEENENCTTKIDLAEARKVADFWGCHFYFLTIAMNMKVELLTIFIVNMRLDAHQILTFFATIWWNLTFF